MLVYNCNWKYVGIILEVYLPRVHAKTKSSLRLANMLALFLALQIQPGEVPNRRSSDCVVGHTPFESSRKPVQCTRHGSAFDMKDCRWRVYGRNAGVSRGGWWSQMPECRSTHCHHRSPVAGSTGIFCSISSCFCWIAPVFHAS